MPVTHSLYQRMLGKKTLGRVRKSQSDMIMDATFDGDISYMIGYFYDYYHDDQKLLYRNLNPESCSMKVPIEVKFIVHGHNSENKDQVGYYIQFKTTQENPIDYYYDDIESKWDCEFPIGLYVDLPDEKGVYRKWLVTEQADWLGLQFPTWYILPVDYVYQWVYQGKDGIRYKYQMCGVQRSQNSYRLCALCGKPYIESSLIAGKSFNKIIRNQVIYITIIYKWLNDQVLKIVR